MKDSLYATDNILLQYDCLSSPYLHVWVSWSQWLLNRKPEISIYIRSCQSGSRNVLSSRKWSIPDFEAEERKRRSKSVWKRIVWIIWRWQSLLDISTMKIVKIFISPSTAGKIHFQYKVSYYFPQTHCELDRKEELLSSSVSGSRSSYRKRWTEVVS